MLSRIAHHSLLRRNLSSMPLLLEEINTVWNNALHSNDLVVLHTTPSYLMDKGMRVALNGEESS